MHRVPPLASGILAEPGTACARRGWTRDMIAVTHPTAAADMTTTPLQAELLSRRADAEPSQLERRSRTAVGAVSDPVLRSRIPVRRYAPCPDDLCYPSPRRLHRRDKALQQCDKPRSGRGAPCGSGAETGSRPRRGRIGSEGLGEGERVVASTRAATTAAPSG